MALFETSKAEIDVIKTVPWYHRFEILPGIITNGRSPFSGALLEPADVVRRVSAVCEVDVLSEKGVKVLELGTWDGPVAYYLKSHGVDVSASDIQDPSRTGFQVLAAISGLEVPYHRVDVYKLHKEFPPAHFDLIIFMGIFYHLKHPILAFENIAHVLKPGGKVFVSGSGLGKRLESIDGGELEPAVCEEAFELLNRLDELGVPLSLNCPGHFNRSSNWIFPNRSALRSWMVAAGLSVTNLYSSIQAHSGIASHRCCGTRVGEAEQDHGLVGGGGYSSLGGL